MNLFRKLWLKNLKKGTAPISHFVEDIGPLKGRLSWTKFNSFGKPVDQQTRTNAITVGGRSAIVRLLAQTNSSRVGSIDPTDYKITKMRFGNALPGDGVGGISGDLPLHYYDITEATSRKNTQAFDADGIIGYDGAIMGPGGSTLQEFAADTNTTPSGATLKNPISYSSVTSGSISNADYTFQPNKTITTIVLNGSPDYPELTLGTTTKPSLPPSHRTLYIELLNEDNETIQKVLFTGTYNKGIEGNPITVVENGLNLPSEPSEVLSTASVGGTRLYYDSNDRKWKIALVTRALIGGTGDTKFFGHQVKTYKVGYNVGLYNIKNSIVPVTGWNTGIGKTTTDRFNNNQDYYSITQSVYSDSLTTPIDDYSVAFSVIMGTTQGNGKSTAENNIDPLTNRFVFYTEAFLFNERDDLFSIIRLQLPTAVTEPRGFVKDPNSSFLLTWQISVDPS